VARHVPDVPPPPYYQRMRSFSSNVDRWFIYDFVLPGTLLMQSGGRPVGQGPDDMRDAVQLHSCQTLTPETETTTHYFFQQSHLATQGDDAITQRIYESLLVAFEEDRRMITAQARNIATNPGTPMLPLAMDSALTRYRRIVQQALEAERTSPVA
jgi:vanillate O-demethylase monooxygenase subunit